MLYNTQKTEETGNIRTVITSIRDEHIDKLEIVKGKLIINTKDKGEIQIAKSIGIEVNPYDISDDGELHSSDGNLLLVDENGTLTIPDRVTKIGEGAFANLEGLKTIIIPGSVKEIGENAFAYNKTLETVILQNGTTTIGNRAFRNCYKLKNITMPKTIENLGQMAFYQCSALTEIEIPGKVQVLRGNIFDQCIALSKVILNEGLVTMESNAFYRCTFSSITLPSTLKTIGVNALTGNENLIDIQIKGDNFVYEEGLLMPKSKENIVFASDKYLKSIDTFRIPEGVKGLSIQIPYTNIKKLVIPASFTYDITAGFFPSTIEEVEISDKNSRYAVLSNDKIWYSKDKKELMMCYSKDKNINLKEKDISIIKESAFDQATNAENIELPDTLTQIKASAFINGNMREVKIGANVSDIASNFTKIDNNINFIIDNENNYYFIENNILYNKNKTKLVRVFKRVKGEFIVKSTIEEIGDSAFSLQNEITKTSLPVGIKRIGKNSFSYCSFSQIEIPETIEEIAVNSFSNNEKLDKIIIHKKENSVANAPWGAVKGMKVIEWTK